MKNKSYNVAVLMGGISSERDVSLRSGKEISAALKKAGHTPIDIIVNDTKVDELNKHDIDVAFIALHGEFGEDGGVQGLLERKCIAYTGSGVTASELAMDKLESKCVFCFSKLPTPDYLEISGCDELKYDSDQMKSIGFPLIVKPASDGSSVGISISNNMEELRLSISEAYKYNGRVVVEKFIKGREFTVSILGDKALPVIEIKPASDFYNYSSKYESNQTRYISSPNIDGLVYSTIQDLALKVHKAIGCRDFSRVDFILSEDGKPYVLEVNTIPGFTKRSLMPMAAKAANIDFVELCDTLITMAINRKLVSLNWF